MKPVSTKVTMPGDLFWKLSEIAEKCDMRVDQYLIELGKAATHRRSPEDLDPVMVRWRKGWTDKEIAADLGWTNLSVAERRQRVLGVPANKRQKAGTS